MLTCLRMCVCACVYTCVCVFHQVTKRGHAHTSDVQVYDRLFAGARPDDERVERVCSSCKSVPVVCVGASEDVSEAHTRWFPIVMCAPHTVVGGLQVRAEADAAAMEECTFSPTLVAAPSTKA